MATVCRGDKSYYEENGRLFDSPLKLQEFDEATGIPLNEETHKATEEYKCECGFIAKTYTGLMVHKKRHVREGK